MVFRKHRLHPDQRGLRHDPAGCGAASQFFASKAGAQPETRPPPPAGAKHFGNIRHRNCLEARCQVTGAACQPVPDAGNEPFRPGEPDPRPAPDMPRGQSVEADEVIDTHTGNEDTADARRVARVQGLEVAAVERVEGGTAGAATASRSVGKPKRRRNEMDDKERRVRQRAHEIWETTGRPHGREHEHWEQATREVHSDAETAASPQPKATARPPKKQAAGAAASVTGMEAAASADKPAKPVKKAKAETSAPVQAAITETEAAGAAKPRRTAKKADKPA